MSGDPNNNRPTTPPPPGYDETVWQEKHAAKVAGRGNFNYPAHTNPTTPPPPGYDETVWQEKHAAKVAGRGNFNYPVYTNPTMPPSPDFDRKLAAERRRPTGAPINFRIPEPRPPRPLIRGPVRSGTREAGLSEALATMDGESAGRRDGRPNVAKIKWHAQQGKKNMAADKVRQRSQLYPRERDAAARAIRPAVSRAVSRALAAANPPPPALAYIVQAAFDSVMAGLLADPASLGAGTFVQFGTEVALRGANARWNFMEEGAIPHFAAMLGQALLADVQPVARVGAVAVWVGLLVAHARRHRAGGGGAREADGETGWDAAARRLQGGAGPRPGGPVRPPAPDAASAARKRIRPAVAPAFAAALDTAVDPDLVLGFVRQRGGTPDLAALRQAYVATAARRFATEFVRTIGSAPRGTSEQLALGAIIAAALAQTGQQFPIVPPPAVPAMSVLIHKTLQPQLPALARMAAAIAAAPAAQPMREMAW